MPLNQGHVYRQRVAAADAGTSVLAYHVARFPHSDAETWRGSIEAGRVLVNGLAARAEEALQAGDRLEFRREPWSEPEAPLAFAVVHEDEHVLVVDKPAGLQVLPAGPFHAHTLLQLVRASATERATSAPVHRLGRGTSGLVLFGKTGPARARLSAQLRAFETQKTYLALARGARLPSSCRARQPIGPVAHGEWSVHAATPEGKPALTRLRVLAHEPGSRVLLVAAQPITGRPNQIRIHLAALGAPLVGDPLYGPGGAPASSACAADGGYHLHAVALSFEHPASGRRLKLRSWPRWELGAFVRGAPVD
jgi:23S rRNA pseudouridine1911/1915/1917 synthase